jgi:hypothetical protein
MAPDLVTREEFELERKARRTFETQLLERLDHLIEQQRHGNTALDLVLKAMELDEKHHELLEKLEKENGAHV